MEPAESAKGGEHSRGRRWFDRAALAAIALMVGHAGWVAFDRAAREGELRAVTLEAESLYAAFERYHERNGEFPRSWVAPAFELDSFEPFRKRGYYDGGLPAKLRNRRADAYGSPDDRGPNQEFWLELSLARDPSVRVLVASSDDAPLGGGDWHDGVYVFRDGVPAER